jgi:hypothetical protein
VILVAISPSASSSSTYPISPSLLLLQAYFYTTEESYHPSTFAVVVTHVSGSLDASKHSRLQTHISIDYHKVEPRMRLIHSSESRGQGRTPDNANTMMEISPAMEETRRPLMEVLPGLNALRVSPVSNLLAIPAEIQLAIISHLVFPEVQFLRCVNHHFMNLIPAPSHSSLLEAEKSDLARSRNAYTCAVCLRLRSPGNFSDAFRMNAFGRDRNVSGTQEKRFCIDCGVKGKDTMLKYRWGDAWTRFGIPYVKCRGCLGKKRGVRERRDCPMCPSCWERKNGRR